MATSTVDVDLLIVGGGIQGLTLLHHGVEQGLGSALLVARDPLGTGETLHSHGYLHRGYSLPPEAAARIPAIRDSFDWWTSWLDRAGIGYGKESPVVFDLPEGRFEALAEIWSEAGLPFDLMESLPAPLQGGAYARAGGRRIVRIHDRLIAPWTIVQELARPLQERIVAGEVTGLDWDPATNRIGSCRVSAGGAEILVRPGCVVLASGRASQPLLRNIQAPDGSLPFGEKCRGLNRLRGVPMVLVKGPSLPDISGWFYLEGPIALMAHEPSGGERTWVVTLMEGHPTTDEDFDGAQDEVEGAVVERTLRALRMIFPDFAAMEPELRMTSYTGWKVDHPEGLPEWFIGDAGIANLRLVWPVLWGLAHGAALAVLEDLRSSGLAAAPGRPFDPASLGFIGKAPPGTELRLSGELTWQSLPDWRRTHA